MYYLPTPPFPAGNPWSCFDGRPVSASPALASLAWLRSREVPDAADAACARPPTVSRRWHQNITLNLNDREEGAATANVTLDYFLEFTRVSVVGHSSGEGGEKFGRNSFESFAKKNFSSTKKKIQYQSEALFQTVKEKCPEKCLCRLLNVNSPLLVDVDCADRSLKALPEELPPNARVLDVSRNQVRAKEPHHVESAIIC